MLYLCFLQIDKVITFKWYTEDESCWWIKWAAPSINFGLLHFFLFSFLLCKCCNFDNLKALYLHELCRQWHNSLPIDFTLIAPELMGTTVHRVCWKDAITSEPLPICWKYEYSFLCWERGYKGLNWYSISISVKKILISYIYIFVHINGQNPAS